MKLKERKKEKKRVSTYSWDNVWNHGQGNGIEADNHHEQVQSKVVSVRQGTSNWQVAKSGSGLFRSLLERILHLGLETFWSDFEPRVFFRVLGDPSYRIHVFFRVLGLGLETFWSDFEPGPGIRHF